MEPRALRRMFLWLFVGCLGLTALIAIVAVLTGDFGRMQARVLGSSGSVSAASICAMACAAFRERGKAPQLGTLGIALAGVALVAVIATIWMDHPSTEWGKVTVLLVIYAVATAHAELLLLPALASRHAWVQTTAVAAIGLLTGLLTVMILGELSGDSMLRLVGVTAIVVALLTLVVPILWKIGGEAHAASAAVGAEPATLALHRAPDGSWVDAAGVRYSLQRLDGGELPNEAGPRG